MKSPLDEIFKSLGSLKEELNEQNKVNIKQKNLEKVNQFLLERKEFLDEQDLDEARSNPEVNVEQPVAKQIEQFVDKYKGQEDLIFISFRDSINVTFINPKNVFNTPTGIYTYPWKNFYDGTFKKYVKDYLVADVGKNIPFKGDSKYMFMYKLKSNQGVLTNQTTYNDTLPYANKLLNLVKNNQKALEIVNAYINDYERYITDYYNDNEYANSYFGDVHTFWILLYLVGDYITKGKTQDTIGNLCRAIGVNGFVDFDGKGYIHPSELHQAVFFRGRELFDDIKIIDRQSSRTRIYNRNLFDYINNKEFIENLNADRFDNLIGNAPNKEFINTIIDTLLSNKNFVSNMDGLIFAKIIYYAKMIDKSAEKIDRITDIVLSNKNFLDTDTNDKIKQLLRYATTDEKRISIINTLFNNENYVDKIDGKGIKYIIEYSPLDSNYTNDEIIKYIVNNNKTTSKIDENNISYLFNNISIEYRTELINILLKRDNIVNNYSNVNNILYQSPERRDEIVDELLQNKSFLSFMKLELGYSNPEVIDFLTDNELLSQSSKQKMANKMIEIRPDIVEKLFMDNQINKVILILKYGKINLDSIINNLNPKYINSNYSLQAVLINLSHPKTFVEERIGVERMKVFFQNYDYGYMIDNAKNKKEIAELITEYTGEDNSDIIKSLTSLQEELNEQNKDNIKEKNLQKVKQFLLEKKGLLDEDITSGSVTVYHRTGKEGSPIEGIAADGYRVGKGDYYGVGVYTTYDLESQLQPKMHTYGNIVIESKVLSMDKFLIFDYDIAKKIYGNVNYTLDNQLRLILGEKEWYNFNKNYGDILNRLIEKLPTVEYTAEIAKDFYEIFKDKIIKYLRGIVFTGQNDGKVLVCYDRKNVEPLRYTINEGQTWVNIMNKNIYQRLKGYKPEESNINFQHILNKLDVGNKLNDDEQNFFIKNIDKFINFLDSKKISYLIKNSLLPEKLFYLLPENKREEFIMNLNDSDINKLIKYSLEPEKLFNLLGNKGKEFIMNLSENGIIALVLYSSKTEKIIEALINVGGKEFIMNLNSDGIDNLLRISPNSGKIIELLINVGGNEFIMNLNLDSINNLLKNSSEPEKNIESLINVGGNEFIMNLNSNIINNILKNSSEPEKIINLLGNKGKEYINELKKQSSSYSSYFQDTYVSSVIGLSKSPKKLINSLGEEIGNKIMDMLPNVGNETFYHIIKLSTVPKEIFSLLGTKGKKFFQELDNNKKNRLINDSKNPNEVMEILRQLSSPINEIFNSLTSLQEELNQQNKMNIKQKNLEKVKNFLFEKKKPLLEDEFYFNSLPDDKKESIYNLFKQSYEGSVGTSWSKDKFYSRAYDWLFFGDENGFVAVRTQKSGLYKLVGVAGSLKSILNGFNELQSKNVPIWGMVSKDIQQMAHKKGFTTPPPFLLKILYKLIPNSVFGNTEFDVNSDGSLTLKYSDVGDAVKYFIGNDEYFKNLKSNILPSMKDEFSKLPSLTKMMINKFLPESVNTLNEELLDEDITSGNVTVYHRTGRRGSASPIQGIAADGYRVGGGAMYGVGVYTTYDLESQIKSNMISAYGNIIIESKVLSLDKFLIFDYDIAKKIYGNVNYTLDNQLRLILGKDWNKYKNDIDLFIKELSVDEYTSKVAINFYKTFKNSIVKYLRGMVFTGQQDGKVLISYDRKNVEPLRYTNDEGQTWTNIINKNIYQRLKGYKPEETDTEYEHFRNKLEAKSIHLTDGDIDYIVNNFDKFRKNINSNNLYDILSNSSKNNSQFIVNKLLQDTNFIDRLNADGIESLLTFGRENRDKVINVLLQNSNIINRLNTQSLVMLIEYSSSPEKVIYALGEKGKHIIKNAAKYFITWNLMLSKEPEIIFNLLEEKKKKYINNLDIEDINNLFVNSKNPEKIIDELVKDDDFIISEYNYYLLTNTKDPKRVIKLLGKNRDKFISKVFSYDINYLLTKSIETEKLVKELNKYTPVLENYINGLNSYEIYELITTAKHPKKLFNVLGQKGIEFINKVNADYLIGGDLIDDARNYEEIEEILKKYNKLPKNNLNEELLDEDISSGSAIVYHRTGKYGNDSALKGIAADGYRVGGGAMYGVGVYTTYDLESQLQDYLRNTYGNIIIESKVLSMDKFLIFDYDIAKKIYGNVNYTLDNQLRLILGNNWRYFKDNSILKNIIEQVAIVKYTADVADTFYKNFTDTIVRNLRGIVFTGRNDGKVLVSYDRKNVEPLRYTTDEAQTWTNIINKNIYQRLKGYKSEEKETHVEHILNKLDVKPKELTDGEINYIIKNIPLFLKRGLTLSKMINFIIEISNDNSKKIIEYIKNIFEKDGQFLSSYVTKEDAKYIGREYNIPKIYSKIIFKLLIKYGGIEFINKLIGDEGIRGLYWFGENSFYRTIIDTMLKYNGKEFLVKNFSEIDTIIYEYFNLYSKDNTENDTTDKFINKMIKIGGKELLYKLATNIRVISNSKIPLIQILLFRITDKNYPVIIDNMLKIGGKEFVNALDKDTLRYIYTKYQNNESLTQKLLKISGKEFADKYKDIIYYLIPNYKDYEKIRDMFSMYDTDQTPMNEIFNSLTSLQEELNEQNKVNVKQKNLEKVRQFLLEKKNSLIEQDLDEARRNPEVNYQPIISKQIQQFVEKHKGQEDLLFVSFRRDINVTFINPKNLYGTPTGIYTYPWKNFYDNIFEKYIKNYLIPDTTIEIPYQGSARYIFLYKLKSNQGILTNQTTYNDTLPYANKLFSLVKNNEYALEIVNAYINDYERYITDYYNKSYYARTSFGDVHTFWILLYLVAERITKGKTQDTIGNLCRAIGVNGFIDFEGKGYIHANEPKQAVFFRGRDLFDDIKIIDTQKQKIYTQNLDAIFNDEDFIKNLDADRLENLLSNARNRSRSEDFNQIFLKLIGNIDDAPIDSIFKLFKYAPTVDIKNQLINKLLKNIDFLEKVKDYDFNYFLNNLNSEQLKYVLLNKSNIILEYGYEINKTILKFIKEDKDLFEIYNKIAKEFYRKEKYIPSDYFWFLRDEEIKKIFLNSKNKTDLQTFIWSMGNDDIDGLKNIKRLFDFGVNENNIFDVIKIYEFVKPENILKLLKGKTLKNYLIYLYNFYNQRDVKTKNSEIRVLFKTSEKPIKLLNLIIKNIGEEKTYELIDGIFDYEMFDSEVTNPEELREIESNILWRNRNSNPNFNILFNFLVKVAHPKKFINNNEVNKYMVDFINKINTTPESWSVLLRMFMKESLNPREIIEIFDEIGNGIATETINKFDEYDKNHLLMSPKNEYQIKQILQQYGKLPKELTETTTPMNEIFKSLTSLQEELNEQRKVTIKESNLMKIQNFIKKKKNNQ